VSRQSLLLRVASIAPPLLAALLAMASIAAPPGNEDEEEEKRWGYVGKLPAWKFTEVYKKQGVADLRDFNADKQKAALDLIGRQLASFERTGNTADIAEIFKAHSFEAIEKIAKAKRIDPETSRKLAQARRQMIQDAMARAVRKIDSSGKLSVGMLDSGNKQSGIASDVDQTLFILPKDLARRLGIGEADVIRQFNAEFAAHNNDVDPGRLGIESMNGADMFPDWRQQHTLMEFGAEADRVTGEKRKNIEAYQSEGQLKSQVERRGYEELLKHHRRVSALSGAEEAIAKLRANPDPDLTEADRAKQIAAVEADLLRQMADEYPGAKNRDELKRDLEKEFPPVPANPEVSVEVTGEGEGRTGKFKGNVRSIKNLRMQFANGRWWVVD